MALCGGIVLEEALDLSSDRILNFDLPVRFLFYVVFSISELGALACRILNPLLNH